MEVINNAKSIGESFLNFFFQSPDVIKFKLNQNAYNSYRDDSIMTFESELFMGKNNIIEKLQQLNVRYLIIFLG